MSLEYRIGDVFDRLAEIPDGSIDCVITSPPFLALRSYLPADHPDKAKEIGSEATPAAFIDTLLRLTAEFGRVLAPHGSLCVELGDTYSGSGGAGGDYAANGLRDGQPVFNQKRGKGAGQTSRGHNPARWSGPQQIIRTRGDMNPGGPDWPLAKSLTGIPQAYMLSLAYGRNVLTGDPSLAGQWRIRNQIVWARPNPPVGALGDKFRPATSYITVACRSPRRFFDLDAVRGDPQEYTPRNGAHLRVGISGRQDQVSNAADENGHRIMANPAGAPPLDWHTDHHPEDGDWLWKLPTQPYKGAHYATFPLELPTRLIMAMCPLRVCTVCGKPSERIVGRRVLPELGELAAHIEQQRQTLGYERRDLAHLFPHYKNTDSIVAQFSNWERGKNVPSPSDWEILQPVLNLSDEFEEFIYTPNSFIEYESNGERLTGEQRRYTSDNGTGRGGHQGIPTATRIAPEGWSDCGHNDWRTGVVLDPFAGSGTTLEAAQNVGRHAIGIDLDPRNANLAQQRVGMFLDVTS